MYNPVVENFTLQIESARSLMKDGQYREAFDLIVNQDVQSLPDLLGKIECLVDIGFVLRDEKILRYSLYLLEKHGSEVLEVPELAPRYFLNLGHQYANMVTLSSFSDEHYGFFKRAEQVKARSFYDKVLSYESVSEDIAFEAYKGLGQMYQSSGRGVEALCEYQKALKLKPASREILHEKIRMMLEYSIPSLPNREEFLQEAWTLMEKSNTYREEEDDQEDIILKTRILNCGIPRDILEIPGEYPIRSVVTNSEEEHFFTTFCVKNSLYLNLCTFCRKCDFTMGDTMALSSSSLTIMQGQKKRFVRLRDIYQQIRKKYSSGRYILSDTLSSGRNKDYLYRIFNEENPLKTDNSDNDFFQLVSAFQTAWSLWDQAAEFISVFWDLEPSADIHSLFYKGKEIREEWCRKPSPSLHAVFDLYSDCIVGKYKYLSVTREVLNGVSSGWSKISNQELKQQSILLFRQMNCVIQYLGFMHERNEFSSTDWDFPRPLYNFVIIKEDINSK